MKTKQEMIDWLNERRLPKKPAPKPAAARAEERFSEDRKPTAALVQDATANNRVLQARLREEREADLRKQIARQQQIDVVWQRKLDQDRELDDAFDNLDKRLMKHFWGVAQ